MRMSLYSLLLIVSITILRSCDAASSSFVKSISVKQSGGGDYRTIRDAIHMGVPRWSSGWIHIIVYAGTYSEQIFIPKDKPYIYLEGEGSRTTIVTYSSNRDLQNGTLHVDADNFIAKGFTFKNTYNHKANLNEINPRSPASAASILGDQVSFYECSFLGVQDTIFDAVGRHYFEQCYIEGFVDFICGNGQSVYNGCIINVIEATPQLGGFITAQKRESEDEHTGFVFQYCEVTGAGPVHLGRAWGAYSRVVFYKSKFPDTIRPEGWDAENHKSNVKHLCYAEADCMGPGANHSMRVPWERRLKPEEVNFYTGPSFNNYDGWIFKQPVHYKFFV